MIFYIVTHRFVNAPKQIKGSIEERYWIYRDVIRFYALKNATNILWYSTSESVLFEINKSIGLSRYRKHYQFFLVEILMKALRSEESLFILLAYPYMLTNVSKSFLLLVLFILRLIRYCKRKRNLVIILDNIDPPVETSISDSSYMGFLRYMLLRVYDILILKLATKIIVLTESYRNYISRLYNIPAGKFIIVPPPALCKLIPYSPPKLNGPLTVLYSGVLKKERKIDDIINAIEELKKEGYNINLILTTPLKLMPIPNDLVCINYPWEKYVKEALKIADIAVIPYPHDKIHYTYTLVAKLFDYLSAGKPVISTPLKETIKVLKKYNCGFVFRDKTELKEILRDVYCNRNKLIFFSENARAAAENFCDVLLARLLFTEIIKQE